MNITPYLYVPFAAWAIAQLIKFSISLIKGEADLKYLYASGGMPSVHSAVVCSLTAWAFIAGGVDSPLFGITAVIAAIVMYDSFGVRRSAGEQARTLNQLISDLSNTGGIKNTKDYNELREILGHKPLEVIIGAALGVFIAACFGRQQLASSYPFLFKVPNVNQAKIIMVAGIVMIISAIVKYYFVAKSKKYRSSSKVLNSLFMVSGAAGVAFSLIGIYAYESVLTSLAEWYLVILVFSAWLLASIIYIFIYLFNKPYGVATKGQNRKEEWLKKAKPKKKRK